MGRILINLVLPVLGLLISSSVLAGKLNVQSPSQRVSLLELYTSEGCSSCPPADDWMSKLKTDPRLWKEVVPVAFHVDYWDYIGWPDRFAIKEAGQRHRRFAQYRHIRQVYTPGLILAGKEWRGWFQNPNLQLSQTANVGKLSLQVDGPKLVSDFESPQGTPANLVLHVARLGFGLKTDVRDGENAGRKLEHDFVVLGYSTYPMKSQGQRFQVQGKTPSPSHPAPREALAAWVSSGNDPFPLQAAGGWLKD